jgi:SAM-dependent methyltransferase
MVANQMLAEREGADYARTSAPFCQLCDRLIQSDKIYARKNGWSYFRCTGCGLIVLHPLPDEPTLRAFYKDDYKVDFKNYIKHVRRTSRNALEDLRLKFPDRGTLLEIGCSYGGFLAEARRDGWNVTGIELNEDAVRYGREQHGLKVFSADLRSTLSERGELYDAVVLFHVIEHVPDPIQFLMDCRKLLKPGGVLVLKTPNASSFAARLSGSFWQWISPPAHLFLYCPRTLDLLLKRTGYQPSTFRSAQGDANNNLFAVLSSVANRTLFSHSSQSLPSLRRSLPVRIIEEICELTYLPCRMLIDPWLDRSLQQPELYAFALNTA